MHRVQSRLEAGVAFSFNHCKWLVGGFEHVQVLLKQTIAVKGILAQGVFFPRQIGAAQEVQAHLAVARASGVSSTWKRTTLAALVSRMSAA